MTRSKSFALAAVLCSGILGGAQSCQDFLCPGVSACSSDGVCEAPTDCPASSIEFYNNVIQIRGSGCRVTMEAIHQTLPDNVTKEGTEYTVNNKILVRDGCILEIHGAETASSPDAAVSLLKLKVREDVIGMSGSRENWWQGLHATGWNICNDWTFCPSYPVAHDLLSWASTLLPYA